MEAYEDDDDTHFCIKCNSTIQGLGNYVRHRQSRCRIKPEVVHEPPSTPTTVSYPEILNADAFFSSLELQSSSKSNPLRTTSEDRLKRSGRNEDRKRKSRKDKSPEDGNSKEKLHNLLPVVTDLEDPTGHLGIPSLVGFPEIVSTSKPSSSGKMTCHSQMVSSVKIEHSEFHGKHDSMESVMSKHLDRKREDSQRLVPDHPVWLEDTLLVDLVGNSENKDISNSSLDRFEGFDYQEEESEEESIEEEDVEEDDISSESDDEDHRYPPQSHTGGKWKPGLSGMSQEMSDLHDEDIEMVAEDENQEQHHPPPSHTGGKWKPSESGSMHVSRFSNHPLYFYFEYYILKFHILSETSRGGK